MKNKNQQTTNDKRLYEFIKNWSLKEWRKIRSLGNSGYVINLRDVSETCLGLLIDSYAKFKRKTVLNQEVFMNTVRIELSKNDWYQFTYEILKLCNSHVNYSLLDKDSNISSSIGIQYYFLNKSMWGNYKYINDQNIKKVYEESPSSRSLQGGLISNYEELLHYDVRDKESRQDLNDFKNWIVGNELSYHENKLKMLCALINRSSYKKIIDFGLATDDYAKDIPEFIKSYPQIRLYSNAFLLHQTGKETDFKNLERSLNIELEKYENLKEGDDLSSNYLEPLYYQLLNYSIKKIIEGKDKYLNKYLNLSLKLLGKGMLIEQGYISGSNFKNICNIYIKKGKFKEANLFINQYEEKLLNGSNNPFSKYCKGLLLYSKKEYPECLNILRSVDSNIKIDDFVKVDIKILIVLTCMQIDKHFKFEHEIRNLTLMLGRKDKVSDNFIEIWKKTTSHLKKIYSIPKHEISKEFPLLINIIKKDPFVKNSDLIIKYMEEKKDKY